VNGIYFTLDTCVHFRASGGKGPRGEGIIFNIHGVMPCVRDGTIVLLASILSAVGQHM